MKQRSATSRFLLSVALRSLLESRWAPTLIRPVAISILSTNEQKPFSSFAHLNHGEHQTVVPTNRVLGCQNKESATKFPSWESTSRACFFWFEFPSPLVSNAQLHHFALSRKMLPLDTSVSVWVSVHAGACKRVSAELEFSVKRRKAVINFPPLLWFFSWDFFVICAVDFGLKIRPTSGCLISDVELSFVKFKAMSIDRLLTL